MQYVYILQSVKYPDKHYIGCTNDAAEAPEKAQCRSVRGPVTSFLDVWSVETCRPDSFEDRVKAFAFEKYLKSGSGRACAKKHF